MKRLILFLCAAGLFATSGMAQQNIIASLQADKPGQGKVTIRQDAAITALVNGTTLPEGAVQPVVKAVGEKKELKRQGYRVQIYAGNNTRQAKNEAQAVANKAKEQFPDLDVYAYFNPPRWLCRVGNYASIEEADAMMRRLKDTGVSREVSIVKDQITIVF